MDLQLINRFVSILIRGVASLNSESNTKILIHNAVNVDLMDIKGLLWEDKKEKR